MRKLYSKSLIKISLLWAVVLTVSVFGVNAQQVDSVSTGPGYTQQAYYSLANGEVATVANDNWELAFDMSGFGSTVRTNGQAGVELYVWPGGSVSDWNNVDTAGLSGWTALYNADTSWSVGAFERNMDAVDPFDLGWGTYSTVNHTVSGDSAYIIRLANGDLRKLAIDGLAQATYTFRYAEISGANEVAATIAKADYPNRNFAYYSLSTGTTLDREPAADAWDLVFTKYIAELGPGTFYGVTGALQNSGVQVAQAYPVANPETYTAFGSHTFNHEINEIGYDWKSFDMNAMAYVMEDSLAYFVQPTNGSIWRIVFTGFGGSATGNIVFEKELIQAVGVQEEVSNELKFTVYPNPATESVDLIFTGKRGATQLKVMDLTGKPVLRREFNRSGFQSQHIDLNTLAPGIYFFQLANEAGTAVKKVVVR